MLKELKNKLLDIESKISNTGGIDLKETNRLSSGLNTGYIPRHSELSFANTVTQTFNLVNESNEVQKLMEDLDRLSVFFYNNKEIQLESFKERLALLDVRQRALASYTDGIRTASIIFNDKGIISPSERFNFHKNGITFPSISQTKKDATISLGNESNVRLGTLFDEFKNSKVSALNTPDLNDLFSVFRADRSSLKLTLQCKFMQKEIVNEIDFKVIRKANQELTISVTDIETGEPYYFGELTDVILFEKPTYTTGLLITILASAIKLNQLDIKGIFFYAREYGRSLDIATVGMPSFSNKYLTVESVNLNSTSQSDLLNFSIKANNAILNSLSSELPLKGPFKDPVFTLNCSIKDSTLLTKYLGDLNYYFAITKPVNYDYKTFAILADEKRKDFTVTAAEAASVFYYLPVIGLEEYFEVSLNGAQSFMTLSTPNAMEHTIEFNGEGYLFTFASLPNLSNVSIKINALPSYIDGRKITLPDCGLGTLVRVLYPTETKRKVTKVITSDNKSVFLQEKYIQSVKLVNSNGSLNTTMQEKALHSALAKTEYCVDYKNGIVYFGQNPQGNIDFDGNIEFLYLETDFTTKRIATENQAVSIPEGIKTFTFNGSTQSLPTCIFTGFQSYNKKSAKVNFASGIIQLPKYICLFKNSAQLTNAIYSRKEVPFVDGVSELSSLESKYDYYDYVAPVIDSGVLVAHKYKLRSGTLAGAIGNYTFSFNDPTFITKKDIDLKDFVPGDYVIPGETAGEYLFLKNIEYPSTPASSYKVKITQTLMNKYFSIDYVNNVIYANGIGPSDILKFDYTSILLEAFKLAKEIPQKTEPLLANEYYAWASNREDLTKLIPYYTPVIESLSIGIIG